MEQWRTVIDDNGEVWKNYEVSTHGRVRSLNYKGVKGRVQELKPSAIKDGYLQVVFHKNGNQKHFLVHRLVALAFIPNPHNKPTVNHLDQNTQNNHVENLQWATMKEQNTHGTHSESSAKARRNMNGKRVLCVETGIIYESTQQAERETGLSQSSISACCRGKRKTCGKCHWEYAD